MCMFYITRYISLEHWKPSVVMVPTSVERQVVVTTDDEKNGITITLFGWGQGGNTAEGSSVIDKK